MLEYIAYSVFGSLCGGFMTYVILKRMVSDEAILGKIELITDEMMKNEEMQKKIYAIGALIGSGIAQGTGLQKKGGKFGLQEFFMQIVGQWLGGKVGSNPTKGEPKPLISLEP